ncbi:MAG: type II toxin-antitoxin system Phd/YefM family antitoxin [Roseiflexaceae bacterium]
MKIAPVADIKARLSSYIDQVETGPVIITKNGRPVAALVAITDDDELERLIMAYTPRLRQLLNDAAERIKQGGGILHDEFWRQVAEEPEIPG